MILILSLIFVELKLNYAQCDASCTQFGGTCAGTPSACTCPSVYLSVGTGCTCLPPLQCSSPAGPYSCISPTEYYLNGPNCYSCTLPLICTDSMVTACYDEIHTYTKSGNYCCLNPCVDCNAITCLACSIPTAQYIVNLTCQGCPKGYICSGSLLFQCDNGYYNNSSPPALNCTTCPGQCATCTNGSCSACVSPCSTCTFATCTGCIATNQYISSTTTCSYCPSQCLTCDSSNCFTCLSPCLTCSWSACLTCIATNYYTSGITCIMCPSQCLTCNSTDICLTCVSPCKECSKTACLTCITSHYYPSGISCNQCDQSCSTCNQTGCLTCPHSNQYILGDVCIDCPSHCPTCNSTTCTSCTPPCATCNFTSCLTCTISNYFPISTKCLQCPSHCPTCIATTCTSCVGPCQTCNWNTCLTCIDSNQTVAGTTCQCNQRFYLLPSKLCGVCDYRCQTCYGQNYDNCASCVQESILMSGICTCPLSKYFSPQRVCQNCPRTCLQCTDLEHCTQCPLKRLIINNLCHCEPGYYDSIDSESNPTCLLCQYSCQTCTDGTSCSSCLVPRILSNNQCPCKIGYVEIYQNCEQCSLGCLNCVTPSQCLVCDKSLLRVLQNNICVCNDESFPINGICWPCHSPQGMIVDSCNYFDCSDQVWTKGEQCDDGNAIDRDGCTRCSIDPGYKCQNTLLQQSICYKCPQNCIGCVYNNNVTCTKCVDGYFLNANICHTCNQNCLTCSTYSYCNSCYIPTFTPDVYGRCPQCEDTPGMYTYQVTCVSICSDSIIAGVEECDDGNLLNGDGCSSACQLEQGYEIQSGRLNKISIPNIKVSYSDPITKDQIQVIINQVDLNLCDMISIVIDQHNNFTYNIYYIYDQIFFQMNSCLIQDLCLMNSINKYIYQDKFLSINQQHVLSRDWTSLIQSLRYYPVGVCRIKSGYSQCSPLIGINCHSGNRTSSWYCR